MSVKITFFLSIICISILLSCQKQKENQETSDVSLSYYGEQIESTAAIEASSISHHMQATDSMEMKIEGMITDVCKQKGCWMKVDMGGGQSLMVRFKDYGFFVPIESAGKMTIIDGMLKKEVVENEKGDDADAACHEDDKLQNNERYSFVARGVAIKEDKI